VALGGFLLIFLLSGLIFPVENIPAGLRWISNIVWGKYYITIVRDALHRPLAPARRKAELLHFARRAARRLSAQIDPTLGDGN
jgi:hypothetical protein